jgi:hypothetical protein
LLPLHGRPVELVTLELAEHDAVGEHLMVGQRPRDVERDAVLDEKRAVLELGVRD